MPTVHYAISAIKSYAYQLWTEVVLLAALHLFGLSFLMIHEELRKGLGVLMVVHFLADLTPHRIFNTIKQKLLGSGFTNKV